jgi:hypothetical protein
MQASEGFWKAGGFRGVYRGLWAAAIGSAPGGEGLWNGGIGR